MNWEEQCRDCPDGLTRTEHAEITPSIWWAIQMDLLRAGGYPMDPEVVSISQFMLLGMVSQEREELRWQVESTSQLEPVTKLAAG